MNCSVLQQLLNGCLSSSAPYVVFRLRLQERLRMRCSFSGVLYFSSTAAVRTRFATLAGEGSLKLCCTSWCARCPPTGLRQLLLKTIRLHVREEKWKRGFFPSLYTRCFEINFGYNLHKLRYQKQMYFKISFAQSWKVALSTFPLGRALRFPWYQIPECIDSHWIWSFSSSG